MNFAKKAGLASAALAVCILAAAPSQAADLNRGYGHGSLKDAPYAMPVRTAGPCYVRGDVGYSWGVSPEGTYVGNAADPVVRSESLDGGAVYEVGIGCGSGSRGLRGDVTLGFRQYDFKGDVDIVVNNNPIDPPISTTLDTYTAMVNGYYDFGNFRGFVPYVGAGVGFAVHDMGYVVIDDPGSPNPQFGDTKVDLAWSVMAGFGYQIASNAIIDVGYRYISLGSAHSHTEDRVLGGPNPRLELDDLAAHEIKVGLRYHFGGSDCCAHSVPMK